MLRNLGKVHDTHAYLELDMGQITMCFRPDVAIADQFLNTSDQEIWEIQFVLANCERRLGIFFRELGN